MNEQGEVVRNKARLVCKGYSQQEGIDYEETYALVVTMEAVRMILAYAVNKKFKVYHMYVKSFFLNGELEEDVYNEQPKSYPLTEEKNIVCRLKKALYGIKQAHRTWYAWLDKYLVKMRFAKGTIDNNLYLEEVENGLLIIVIFAMTMFGGNDEESDKFAK